MSKTASDFTPEQIGQFKEVFKLFDVNGDGSISCKELGDVLQKLGQHITEDELKDIMSGVDTDGNGEIDFDEFLSLMPSSAGDAGEDEDDLRAAFDVFDQDGNGYIDHDELEKVMISLGENVTTNELKEMFCNADTDGDGKISFEEFKAMMTSGSG